MISLFRRVLEQVIEQTNFEIQIAAKPLDASGEAASIYIYTYIYIYIFIAIQNTNIDYIKTYEIIIFSTF